MAVREDPATGTALVIAVPSVGTEKVQGDIKERAQIGPVSCDSDIFSRVPKAKGENKYELGDVIEYQDGKPAFTVRKFLGKGAFGEVNEVWSEIQQVPRAMKCTKLDFMGDKERSATFKANCEEALVMLGPQHHPNIISLRFTKVSGNEFLVIMDLVEVREKAQDMP